MIYLFRSVDDGPSGTLGTTVLLRSDFPRAEELLGEVASTLHCGAKVLAVFEEECLRGGTEPVDLDDWITFEDLPLLKSRSFSPVVAQFERHVRGSLR